MRTDENRETRLSTDDIVGADRDHSTRDGMRETTQDGMRETTQDGMRDDRTESDLDAGEHRTDAELSSTGTPNAAAGNGESRWESEDTSLTDEDAPLTEDAPREPNQGSPRQTEDTPFELFGGEEVERFRIEWREIQARFVDDPRDAVQGADHLVAEVMQSLASTFSDHKHELEGQWQHGSEAETEDLRQALRRYRTFFNQLLNA